MRWIKHMTATMQDEKIAAYLDSCGPSCRQEGYGFFWMVLEIVAAQIEPGSDKFSATYPLTSWSRMLYCHHHTVGKYLGKLEVTGMVTVKKHEGSLEVGIPNLLKYRDEWSDRKSKTREPLGSKKQIQRQNRETDTHTEEIPSVRSVAPILKQALRAADLNGQTSQKFEDFWTRYPRKQHRDAACMEWLSVVTVESEPQVFDCLGRYLASDEVARGAVQNPEKWLMEQHRDGWAGDWPKFAPRVQESRETPLQSAIRKAKEEKNGTR